MVQDPPDWSVSCEAGGTVVRSGLSPAGVGAGVGVGGRDPSSVVIRSDIAWRAASRRVIISTRLLYCSMLGMNTVTGNPSIDLDGLRRQERQRTGAVELHRGNKVPQRPVELLELNGG